MMIIILLIAIVPVTLAMKYFLQKHERENDKRQHDEHKKDTD